MAEARTEVWVDLNAALIAAADEVRGATVLDAGRPVDCVTTFAAGSTPCYPVRVFWGTPSVAAMPAPHWFFRFVYDCESTAWERGRNAPEHLEQVERTVDLLAKVVAPPGPVADLGCGPGAHALALARRGYSVIGVDGSPRMVEVARARATRDRVDATFDVNDVSATLDFADASLGGVLAILVLQHLSHPEGFLTEVRRCLRQGGHLLITAPVRDGKAITSQQDLYWRLRAACYHLVPGVIRFYDTASLAHLVEDGGLTVVESYGEPGRASVLARA